MSDTNTSPVSPPSSSARWRFLKMAAMWVPTILAALVAGFFYWQWQQAQQAALVAGSSTEVVTQAQREEIETIIADLGKVVLLPTGELPTLSTIKNKDALTENQEFFLEAENGDKVLVYEQAKKAFLYRPTTKQLINLAPINLNATDTPELNPDSAGAVPLEPTPTPEELSDTFTVELRNGTATSGLTLQFAPRLTAAFANGQILDRTDASNSDYEQSLVVPVNLAKKQQAQLIAEKLNLGTGTLPSGERESEADIVIILGGDQVAENTAQAD